MPRPSCAQVRAMTSALRGFLRDESGVGTAEWVVLAGASVALALIMMSTMNSTTAGVAVEMGHVLESVTVAPLDATAPEGG